jgi:hypothetical protein
MKGAHMDQDEHSPYWQPPKTKTVDFFAAVLRGALFAVAVAMFLTLLGCDDYERELAVAEYRERFMEACMPRKGDLVTVEWVKGQLICQRATPTGRYGRTFPHTENRIAIVEPM